MIPGNSFTVTPIVGTFLYLQELPYTPLHQQVLGGVALGDGSMGRLVKPWEVTYASGNITVNPVGGAVELTLAEPDVSSVSLAFDANMSPVIAWQGSVGTTIYFFNGLTSTYVTQTFSGTTSCRVCVDDPREFYSAQSDVMLGYTLNGNLCYRQQRDRYSIEYIASSTTKQLIKFGPSSVNRLQFGLI